MPYIFTDKTVPMPLNVLLGNFHSKINLDYVSVWACCVPGCLYVALPEEWPLFPNFALISFCKCK